MESHLTFNKVKILLKTMKQIEHIVNSIENAENNKSNINPDSNEGSEILSYEGMTGIKTRHLYNNICSKEDARYLEIGTWYGSSSISAMYKNNVNGLFIDNWSQFGGYKSKFENIMNKYNLDYNLIESDCWEVDLTSISQKFNIYLYDGGHHYEDHYNSLLYYYTLLDDEFTFLVDDWNWPMVQKGTMDAIRDLNLQIKFKHEIFVSKEDVINMPNHNGKNTWWNGIGIFYLIKLDK